MEISLARELAMGHRLYGYQGKCANLHGHNYGFEVSITGNPDAALGLVMDFRAMGEILDNVLDPFDHCTLLMEGDPFEDALKENRSKHQIMSANPSAENIGSLLFNLFRNEGLPVSRVLVRETSDSCAYVDKVDRNIRIIRGVL